jgi:hypothetical protein
VWHTARHRLQTPRSGLAAAVSPGGTCFALAGWGGAQQGFLSSAECLQAEPPPPPAARCLSSSSSSGGSSSGGGSSSSSIGATTRSGARSNAAEAIVRPTAAAGRDVGVSSLSHVPVPSTAALHMARHCPAAAALGRYLYLTGGSGTSPEADAGIGAQPTASVERLDMEARAPA